MCGGLRALEAEYYSRLQVSLECARTPLDSTVLSYSRLIESLVSGALITHSPLSALMLECSRCRSPAVAADARARTIHHGRAIDIRRQ